MSVNNEREALLTLVKNGILEQNESVSSSELDFKKLFELIDKHSVNMLCLDGAKQFIGKMPYDVYYNWIYFASRKMTINENIIKTQKKLTDILENNGIPYFVFKGLCSSYYYAKPELRELGDVDFYVDFLNLEKADELLKSNGFRFVSKDDEKHWNYKFEDVEIEMHYDFWDMPNNQCAEYLKSFLKNSVNQPKKYTVNNYTFFGTDTVAHAVVLVLHIINHIQRGGIGLRHICDFAVFLNSNDFRENYNDIINAYKKGGIYKTAQVAAKMCSLYLGSYDYDFTEETDTELLEMFYEDVLDSGNFGGLSKEAYYGSSLFTTDKSRNENFIQRLTALCKSAWEPCKKHKPLLIIAPFYVGGRYVFRAILGKRPKINPVKFAKTSIKRAELYKKLDFFEEDKV